MIVELAIANLKQDFLKMNCPECKSNKIHKNGKKRGKQNYLCVQCGRQFITEYNQHQGYSEKFKRECLKLYINGMGFRAIERVKGVHNTTVMAWVKEVGELLPNAYDPETTPQVGELDELETFVGQKKTRFGTGCAVDHFKPGILGWVLGDHSTETFQPKRENSGKMEMLFLCHGRMEGLSTVYSRRRPNYLQNLYD